MAKCRKRLYSISKVLHVRPRNSSARTALRENRSKHRGESHSTDTSRRIQVLRKQRKCIYRGNCDVSRPSSPGFSSRRSVDSRSSSSRSARHSADSVGCLDVGVWLPLSPSRVLDRVRLRAVVENCALYGIILSQRGARRGDGELHRGVN